MNAEIKKYELYRLLKWKTHFEIFKLFREDRGTNLKDLKNTQEIYQIQNDWSPNLSSASGHERSHIIPTKASIAITVLNTEKIHDNFKL